MHRHTADHIGSLVNTRAVTEKRKNTSEFYFQKTDIHLLLSTQPLERQDTNPKGLKARVIHSAGFSYSKQQHLMNSHRWMHEITQNVTSPGSRELPVIFVLCVAVDGDNAGSRAGSIGDDDWITIEGRGVVDHRGSLLQRQHRPAKGQHSFLM